MKKIQWYAIKASCILMVIVTFLFINFSSCKTKEPQPKQPEQPKQTPAPEIKEEQPEPTPPTPYASNWNNTTWIIREKNNQMLKTYPGYRGFHLAGDGRLLLVNLDTAIGNRWSANENSLHLEILEGISDIPLDGKFHAYLEDNEDKDTTTQIRLIPDVQPDSEGLVFEQANVLIDMEENHWTPKSLNNSETIPWPQGKDIHLILLPNGLGGLGVIGYGGVNRFNGDVYIEDEGKITFGPLASTRRTGHGIEFEMLFLGNISQVSRYVQVEKDLFLYADTTPMVAFRAQLFN